MRWLFTVIAVAGLALTVMACGEEEEGAATPTPVTTEEASPEVTSAPEATPTPEPTPTPEATALELKLAVHDDTQNNPPTEIELWTTGLGSWHPYLAFGGDHTVIAPYELDSSPELFIYPDGRDGLEIKVVMTLSGDMISRSDRDTVHVEIHDNIVKVWGTPIEGLEQEFSR